MHAVGDLVSCPARTRLMKGWGLGTRLGETLLCLYINIIYMIKCTGPSPFILNLSCKLLKTGDVGRPGNMATPDTHILLGLGKEVAMFENGHPLTTPYNPYVSLSNLLGQSGHLKFPLNLASWG